MKGHEARETLGSTPYARPARSPQRRNATRQEAPHLTPHSEPRPIAPRPLPPQPLSFAPATYAPNPATYDFSRWPTHTSSPDSRPLFHLLAPVFSLSFTSSPPGSQPLFHLLAPGFSASPSQPPPPVFSPPAAATRYKEARNSISLAVARPRWLMLFFSSSGISAKVSSYPSGRNTGS